MQYLQHMKFTTTATVTIDTKYPNIMVTTQKIYNNVIIMRQLIKIALMGNVINGNY